MEPSAFRLCDAERFEKLIALGKAHPPFAMAKGADGVWNLTVPSLLPSINSYSFTWMV